MEKEKLEQKIESILEMMEESLKYQLEAQCELLSNIQTMRYLGFLLKDKKI